MKPEAKPSGRVFDVRRPGKTPASPTSKPVIVSDRPQVQDPSVTVNGVGERTKPSKSKQIRIRTDGEIETVAVTPLTAPEASPPTQAPAQPTAQPSVSTPETPPDALVEATAADIGPAPPHGPVVSRRAGAPKGQLTAMIVLIVFLALVVIDILLDADVIDVQSVPRTNFF